MTITDIFSVASLFMSFFALALSASTLLQTRGAFLPTQLEEQESLQSICEIAGSHYGTIVRKGNVLWYTCERCDWEGPAGEEDII